MRQPTHEDPTPGSQRAAALLRGRGWTLGTPLVLALCGTLMVTSAEISGGKDLRPSRLTDIASAVKADRATADRLTERVATLNAQVASLSEARSGTRSGRWTRMAEELVGPAGLTAVVGSGVVVELDDAPASVAGDGTNDNNLVVHQQDLQGVINALWKGGARAITLMGQRIVSTTGIKCEGNVVTLHGIPYSPPYRIEAIGDPVALQSALDNDRVVQAYREDAADPEIQLGWSSASASTVTAPAYEGLTAMEYATPIG